MALITLNDVTVRFEGVTALSGVSGRVERGDYLVILGENGSGKTTLMRSILGLVQPDCGSIVFSDGLKQNQIGYLPQQTQAQRGFPASVREVVLSGCTNTLGKRLFYTGEMSRLADAKMKLLGIEDLKYRSYKTLSGGQQQRALLARALCATDSILLLDEPVTGLDPEATEEMYALIRRLNREEGVAVVMVTHDTRAALKDAKHVLVIRRGVEFWGSIEDYKNEERA